MATKTIKTKKSAVEFAPKNFKLFDCKLFSETVENLMPALAEIVKPMLPEIIEAIEPSKGRKTKSNRVTQTA